MSLVQADAHLALGLSLPTHTGFAVVTIPIPTSSSAGTYYLLACADATLLAVESNEGNNCKHAAATVTIRP